MKVFLINIIFIFLFFSSCNKDELKWNLVRKNPYDGNEITTTILNDGNELSTATLDDITDTTCDISGEIISISNIINSYGHCWSINPTPTVNDSTTNLGTINSIGVFSSKLKNLTPNTTYYVRSYATNTYGTSYGNQVTFKTKTKLCDYFNCESLANFNFHVYQISPSYSSIWSIGSGYKGNGITLTESSYGGYVEFTINYKKTTKLSFWTQSINPGYKNMAPTVTVDGIESNTILTDGSFNYNNWMKLESQNITSGKHIIRIDFRYNSSYLEYYLDEIEFRFQ